MTDISHLNVIVLKDAWPTTDRSMIEGEAFKNLQNAFGIATVHAIYRANYETGAPQTTSIFLPNDGDVDTWRYKIFTTTTNIRQPEPRVRMSIAMTSLGTTLLDCSLGKGLATKFAHAILGELHHLETILHHTDHLVFSIRPKAG